MRIDINTDYLVKLYVVEHLTLREIGKRLNISHSGVAKRLKLAGIASDQGEWVNKECQFCSKEYKVTRSRKGNKYCSQECYSSAITSPKSHLWRHGQRLARLIVAQHFPLQAGQVVHHIDGDDRNNDRNNLVVYASQAEHVSSHRGGGGKVTPIWVGKRS